MTEKEVRIKIRRDKFGRIIRPSKSTAIKKAQGHKAYHRRTQPSGNINFYDFGYLKTGDTFHDLEFFITVAGHGPLTSADFLARDAAVFAITGSDYKGKAYKLTKAVSPADKYYFNISFEIGVDSFGGILADVTQFDDDDGLVLPDDTAAGTLFITGDAEALKFFPFGFFPIPGTLKVTETYNFAAPASDFAGSTQMDIFMMPNLIQASGQGEDFGKYIPYRRSLFLENEPSLTYLFRQDANDGSFPHHFLTAIVKSKNKTYYYWISLAE